MWISPDIVMFGKTVEQVLNNFVLFFNTENFMFIEVFLRGNCIVAISIHGLKVTLV